MSGTVSAPPRHDAVHVELWGNVVQVLGWIVIFVLASIVIIPAAWVLAAIGRWFCRELHFSDGRKASFTGQGGEILGWWVLWSLAGAFRHSVGHIGLFSINVIGIDAGVSQNGNLVVSIAQWLLGLWAGWQIIRWCIEHVEFDNGEHFTFEGGYWPFAGWETWVGVLGITVIGWAWGLAAMCRWMAEETRSAESTLRFWGLGHQILWRSVVLVLLCILIIPIPWACLWYTQWTVQNVTIEARQTN